MKHSCFDPEDTNYVGLAHYGTMAQIYNPARMIMLGESKMATCRVCPHTHTHAFPPVWLIESRHHGGASYVFYDGHVEWLRYDQTITPVSMWKNLP